MPIRFYVQVRIRFARITWICVLVCLALLPSIALADAGTVRVSQRSGNRQITVFTDPTPLRAGPIDVSVLVQDLATGGTIFDDAIEIEVAPRGHSAVPGRFRATSAAASNKLFQAANFELRHAGWWEFTVNVQGSQGSARIHFEVEAGEPLPPWQAMWPWFCWPFLVVAIFIVIQVVAFRSAKGTSRCFASQNEAPAEVLDGADGRAGDASFVQRTNVGLVPFAERKATMRQLLLRRS